MPTKDQLEATLARVIKERDELVMSLRDQLRKAKREIADLKDADDDAFDDVVGPDPMATSRLRDAARDLFGQDRIDAPCPQDVTVKVPASFLSALAEVVSEVVA